MTQHQRPDAAPQWHMLWLDLQPVEIKSRWRHNWKLAQVVSFHRSVWPHNPATVVSAKPFSHGTGTLRCLQKEIATYRHWSVSLWQDPDDVPHCRILSPDKTEWRLISATLCGWRCCFVADQLWFMTRIREEEEEEAWHMLKHIWKCPRQSCWSVEKAVTCSACVKDGDRTSLWTSAKMKPALLRATNSLPRKTRCFASFPSQLLKSK